MHVCQRDQPRRTLAYHEVSLRIGPLAKLGHLKSSAQNFLVYIVAISFASWSMAQQKIENGYGYGYG